MKRKLLSVIFCFAFVVTQAQEKSFLDNIYQYLENIQKFELNQEAGHVPLVPYFTVNEALENDRSKATSFLSLNGTWKFHFASTPEGTPEKFFAENFNDKKWDTIHVPSNWEMQGFGDPLLSSG
ncbi:MAG: hypothetical protein WC854_13780 [Bacteroidales bacterium]